MLLVSNKICWKKNYLSRKTPAPDMHKNTAPAVPVRAWFIDSVLWNKKQKQETAGQGDLYSSTQGASS
jgi:hypothetical protein